MVRNLVKVGNREVKKRYIGNKLIFEELGDKTEILSGEEIFTDQADDSVVHVEVDGETVGGGSGKNLLPDLKLIDGDNTGARKGIQQHLYVTLKAGTYTLSYNYHTTVQTWIKIPPNAVHASGNTIIRFTVTEETTYSIVVQTADSADPKHYKMQIEEGSTATEYEPPAPTPDYPIEIHSLNDFDVVSSTEKLSEGQLEEYNHDTEYENIYKINISLNEPLRSVGDVKDRVFRGSDGLWKVERNVEVTGTEDGTQSITDAYSPYDVPVIEVLSDEYQNKLSNLRSFRDSNYVYTIINNETDILSDYVVDNVKPTLHTTFKSKGWYDYYKKALLK